MKHTKIIATAIQKGGVGKTFIATHVAYLLAEDNYPYQSQTVKRPSHSVTFIDFDPQCNGTLSLLVRNKDAYYSGEFSWEPAQTSAAFFGWTMVQDQHGSHIDWDMSLPFPKAIDVPPVFGTYYDGRIKCIPAHKDALAETDSLDLELSLKVAERIRQYALECDSDYVVLDCSPQLGIRQLVAMFAADYIITPINAELYSEIGLAEFLDTYYSIRSSNPQCELVVVPNRIDFKTKATQSKLESLREQLGDFMTKNCIPNSGSITNAIDASRPVWRKPPGGNDAAVASKVRKTLSEALAKFGIDAK